jgi:hypothetical protein
MALRPKFLIKDGNLALPNSSNAIAMKIINSVVPIPNITGTPGVKNLRRQSAVGTSYTTDVLVVFYWISQGCQIESTVWSKDLVRRRSLRGPLFFLGLTAFSALV